jgi:hypothetical protein
MEKQVYIFDLEQFINFHSGTFMNRETKEIKQFVIHTSRNDITEYYNFLKNEVSGLIGFNNINYDYPLIHFLLINNHFISLNPDTINKMLFEESQRLISEEWTAIPDSQCYISQLDLYKIWHFDNKARRQSLKGVEISMNFDNVQDMPFNEEHWVEKDDVQKILDYNLNDVNATEAFYNISLDKIQLRKDLSKKYEINLLNANDPKIGSEIFAKLLADKKGISIRELKQQRTYRKIIKLKDCILPYIKFETKEFNKLLEFFKSKIIDSTKDAFSYSVIFNGIKHDYGVGGIHSFSEPDIYVPKEDETIMSCDVTSLYPNIGIRNNFYPEHLGTDFCEIYEDIFIQRTKIPKSNPINYAFKLMLNGTYGKSNDKYSFFYDPLYTMKITVNGQLLLSMLVEKLQLAGFRMLMVNTDGMECIVPKVRIDDYYSICKEWENITNLSLEFAEYKKLVLRDVNNYIGVFTNNKVKYKGTFEIDKEIHKDNSMRIVKIALSKYYIDGIKPEETITKHTDIYDFCKRYKSTKGWQTEYHSIKYIDNNPILNIDKLSKNTRYFISTKGGSLWKRHKDGRLIGIDKDQTISLFNKYENKDMKDYNINYPYYINETNKIIKTINNGQFKLF